jgi:hypothetical protein
MHKKNEKSLKNRIYYWHLERDFQKFGGIAPITDIDGIPDTPEERGFNDPKATVPISVPLADERGNEYGSRVDMMTPVQASHICESYRQDMVSRGKDRDEARFWLKVSKKVILVSLFVILALIVIIIALVI